MRSTFNVLFYVKKNQPKKNGLCPVMGRITIDGKIVQFSCKFDIDPKIWDVDAGRASPNLRRLSAEAPVSSYERFLKILSGKSSGL